MFLNARFPIASTSVRGATLAIILGCAVAPAYAQADLQASDPLPQGSFLDTIRKEVHFYGTSLYSSYQTGVMPGAGGSANNLDAGASATIGWRHAGFRTHFLLVYTGVYSRQFQNSGESGFSHLVSLRATRDLAPSWNFTALASGELVNLTESLFRPSAEAQTLALTPNAGAFASAPVGYGGALSELSGHSLFSSDRLLRASLAAMVSHNYSPRLSLTLLSRGSRVQSIENHRAVNQPLYVAPRIGSVEAGFTLSYLVSPKTQLGLSSSSGTTWSSLVPAYDSSVSGSIARTIGDRISLEAHGGVGGVFATFPGGRTSSSAQYLAGGSFGIREQYQTLSLSVDRNLLSAYGYGSGSVLNTTGSWRWKRANRPWSPFLDLGEQHAAVTGVGSIDAILGGAGISANLSPESRISLSYSYLRSTSASASLPREWSTQGIRLTIEWSPRAPAL